MTPSELKIAEFLDHNRHMNAFETVASISQKVGVSKATVVRFISHMGYASFYDFRKKMREEISYKLESPLSRYLQRKSDLTTNKADIVGRYFSFIIQELEKTYSRIDPNTIEKIARLIMGGKGFLYIIGQRRSYGLAYLLWTLLKHLRSRVILLDNHASMLPDRLIDVTPEDLLIAITRRRHSKHTYLTAKHFAEQGAKIILFSDKTFTPLSHLAQLQLIAYADGPSIFDSLCPTMALLETIIFAILSMYKDGIPERLQVTEKLFAEFETFCE
jgi:DNA-binding MurR/RpiR family transcriptional regulator